MHEKTWRVIALLGLLLGAACGDPEPDDGGGGTGTPGGGEHRPGLGSSTKPPEGQRFSLPSGVEFVTPISGYSVFEPESCAPEEEARGAGSLVRVCMRLRNTTNTTSNPVSIPVIFPAGFTVVSDSETTQNGLLVQNQTVTVEPGEILQIPLYFFCLNETRSASSPADSFQPGPILQYQDFQEFFDLLKDKPLEPADPQVQLQAATWRLSQGDSLTAADRSYISGL